MVSSPLSPNGRPIRERIMLFGPPKVGKTHQFLTIARHHKELGSDAKFYAISTDTSFEVLMMNPEFQELDNVIWEDAVHFQDYVELARKFTAQMEPHDWLTVDLMSDAWSAVQDEYARVQTKHAGGNIEDVGDLWATGSDGGEKYPIAGWEWGMPNARYRILANNILLRCPGHLLLVYGQKEMLGESGSGKTAEKKNVKEMFGHLGVKPNGQKDDPFRYHTVIAVDSAGPNQQQMATAGERWGYRKRLGKAMSNGQVRLAPIEDFFDDYLVEIAGWTK